MIISQKLLSPLKFIMSDNPLNIVTVSFMNKKNAKCIQIYIHASYVPMPIKIFTILHKLLKQHIQKNNVPEDPICSIRLAKQAQFSG